MSTGKHIDKICIAAVAITLVLTILFMFGSSLGLAVSARAVKYESTLFDASYVHSIDIVMNNWDSFIQNCENEEYASCTVVVDGEKHSNIAIRAKGNTSLSSVRSMGSQRYSFKLEFDHYEDGKTLDGLDKLCLNNLIQDNTMMKDYLTYQLMDDFGVDSPLCSYVYLSVNGEDWGLYLAVEGVEDSFLSRNYGSDTGELYKPDSMSFGGGRGNGKNFNMDDFNFGGSGTEESGSQKGQQRTADNPQQGKRFGFSMGGNGGNPFGQGDQRMTPPEGNIPSFNELQPGMQLPGTENPKAGTVADKPEDFQNVPAFGSGNMPNFGDFSGSGVPDMGNSGEWNPMQNGFGGFGGMGSDDVKLKYIDDDPDSYSNIFSNAKTEISSADKKRLISALKNLSSYTDLENTLDMEEVLRYFVVHNFVCNGDSYTGAMIHNYYLHESNGKLGMIPWDYNLAFGTFQGGNAASSVNADIDNPVSGDLNDRPMVGWIFSDETYTEQYHELFASFLDKWFSDGELEKQITDTAEMIRPYVEKDPTKFCTTEAFETGVSTLKQFVSLRAEAVDRQLSGDDTAVTVGALNLSDMGSMSQGFGGGMDRSKGNDFGGFTRPDSSDSRGEDRETGETAPKALEDAGKNQRPSGSMQSDFRGKGMEVPGNPGASSGNRTWILLGVSVIVLVAGLLVAWKKKY